MQSTSSSPTRSTTKRWTDTQRAQLVHNLASHMKGIKSKAVLERQLSVFAAVDEGFAGKLVQSQGMQPVKL